MEKKTECEIVQDLLLGYIDNVLNNESKKLVEKHLIGCSKCQKRFEEINTDIEQNDTNQKKEIDYLKKIRIKSRIKSVLIAVSFILVICFVMYFSKFIKINSIMNNAKKSLESNNIYKEKTEMMSNGETIVTKEYYKDGKYKSTQEIYSDEGVITDSIKYSELDSDKIIYVNEKEKKATIEKGNVSKMLNSENGLKWVPFILDRQGIFEKIGTAFTMSIETDTYDIGREYYILKDKSDTKERWEIWIDKETGLPLKEINKEGVKTFFPGTSVVKSISDTTQEYKYEFGTVKDEDVELPDLTEYKTEYTNFDLD